MKNGSKLFHQTRAPRTNMFGRPFAETFQDPYPPTYVDAFSQLDQQGLYRDIFDPKNIDKTIWHIYTHVGNPFFGLGGDDILAVSDMLDEIKFLVEINPGQTEYSSTLDDDSVTITKAADILSPDYHLSYNKATLKINEVTITWYFLLNNDDAEVEGDNLANIQKDPAKPEILYEKSDNNKVEGFNRNNTGYKFWWSDGRVMDHGDVENFINRKRAAKDNRFLADFPVVEKGELAPSYTIAGRKQPYFAYDKRLKDPYEDGSNLQSSILSGNNELEQTYDGNIFIGTGSRGDCVNRLKASLNKLYKQDPSFSVLTEDGKYDSKMIAAVKKFQTSKKLSSKNGVVGSETLKALDAEIVKIDESEVKAIEEENKRKEDERKAREEYAIDHPEPTSAAYQVDLTERLQRPKILAMVTALSTVGNKLYGEPYHPELILELTEKEKQSIFLTDADKTLAILMSEFVEGHGREIRDFGPETPISEKIKYSYTTSLFLTYFVEAYKQGLYDEGVMNGPLTIFTSPDNANQNPPGLPGSREIAIKAFGQGLWNAPAFYTGSLDYFFTIKGDSLEVIVHNEYSIASGVTRDDNDNLYREEGKLSPLSNTKQLFYFTFDISKLKK